MNEKKGTPWLICASGGFEYQMISDERYLYLVRLGRERRKNRSRVIDDPAEFAPIMGNVRLARAQIDSVHCTLSHNRTVIEIVHGELSDRFVAHERLDEERLLAVFSGLPLRMTTAQRHGGMPVFLRVEIAMFFAAFALALADIAASGMPALDGLRKWIPLGWMLIPLVWLAGSARRTGRNRVPFAIGVGAMASVFCCVFLWLTPSWRPDQWGQAVLPALVVALIAAVLYAAGRRRFEPVRLAVVFLAALIAYAPGTVLCLNNLSERVVANQAASVVEVGSEYSRGDYAYYVVVETDGVQSYYQVSRDEYTALSEGAVVQVVHRTGLLGIEHTDVECL